MDNLEQEQQFLNAARKRAAEIKTNKVLVFKGEEFTKNVDAFKKMIMAYEPKIKDAFLKYQLFCEPSYPTLENEELLICAYVELANEQEQKALFAATEENAKNPEPILPGFPGPAGFEKNIESYDSHYKRSDWECAQLARLAKEKLDRLLASFIPSTYKKMLQDINDIIEALI